MASARSFAKEAGQQETPLSLGRTVGIPQAAAQYLIALRSEIGQLRRVLQEQSECNDCLNVSLHEQETRIKNLENYVAMLDVLKVGKH
jgi:hypothetical protein